MAEQPSRLRKSLRVINRLGITSLALGIGATVIKAWAAYWLGPAALSPKQPAQAPVAAAMAPAPEISPRTIEDLLETSPISLADWQANVERIYETNSQRERVFRKYLGKEVVWEGYFDQFHEVAEPQDAEHACTLIVHESRSTLFEKRLLGPPTIRCWLPASAAVSLKQLERGDWIVIRGQINDPLLAGSLLCTDLEQTEILISNKIRAAETALSPDAPVIR